MRSKAFVVSYGVMLMAIATVDHVGPLTESDSENLVMGLIGLTCFVVGWISVWKGDL